jgi:hypothetical protein
MLSTRTADYIATLHREGAAFDYGRWLEKARQEEAQAKLEFALGESPDRADARPLSRSVLLPRTTLVPRARSVRNVKSDIPEDRLGRRLLKICGAWNNFRKSRDRDAVYSYLTEIYRTVEHYRVRRRTDRLLRHAFEFADLPFNDNINPYTALIRCTSGGGADKKTISKWSRALRYASHCKVPRKQLKAFIKELGGVNACADRYARYCRQAGR